VWHTKKLRDSSFPNPANYIAPKPLDHTINTRSALPPLPPLPLFSFPLAERRRVLHLFELFFLVLSLDGDEERCGSAQIFFLPSFFFSLFLLFEGARARPVQNVNSPWPFPFLLLLERSRSGRRGRCYAAALAFPFLFSFPWTAALEEIASDPLLSFPRAAVGNRAARVAQLQSSFLLPLLFFPFDCRSS